MWSVFPHGRSDYSFLRIPVFYPVVNVNFAQRKNQRILLGIYAGLLCRAALVAARGSEETLLFRSLSYLTCRLERENLNSDRYSERNRRGWPVCGMLRPSSSGKSRFVPLIGADGLTPSPKARITSFGTRAIPVSAPQLGGASAFH